MGDIRGLTGSALAAFIGVYRAGKPPLSKACENGGILDDVDGAWEAGGGMGTAVTAGEQGGGMGTAVTAGDQGSVSTDKGGIGGAEGARGAVLDVLCQGSEFHTGSASGETIDADGVGRAVATSGGA